MSAPTTLEFLRAILPANGKYCRVVIDGSRVKQDFYDNIEDFASELLSADQAERLEHHSVYHACATYTGGNRKSECVVAVRSLWCEFDCGDPGDPYKSIDEALLALAGFCRKLSLPIPIVVRSGGGLHCYWPFDVELSRQQWDPIARAFKAALKAHNVHADPQRTADVASILRPPGTVHRKGEPKLIVCGPLMGPYPLGAFAGLRPFFQPKVQIEPKRERAGSAPDIVDFDALCQGCAQLRDFRDTCGVLPEPLWYAGLGVLAFCQNGDEIGHKWSSGHPNYSPQETQARLDRARRLTGPTTCRRFKECDDTKCVGCAFGDSTPLEAAKKFQKLPEQDALRETDAPPRNGERLIPGRDDYKILHGGVYAIIRDEGGEPVEVMLTAYPVVFKSVHVGEIKQDQNYYLMRHWKPHAGWREIELKASQVYGPQMITTMADLGIVVHNPQKFQSYARAAIDALHAKEKARMQYEQFGWKNENTAFLYGDVLYTADDAVKTAVSSELRHRAQWLRPTPGGSVEGWKSAVDNLMGQGSEGMSFTILASFAAPLMRLLEPNEGGSIINLMTRASGRGKTTSLSGACTVWSSSEEGLGLTQIDTKVSKAVLLGTMANLPVIYDEFTNKDPAIVREFTIMFTSGRDKMRADSSGQLIHKAAKWQTILFTASNQSLRDTIMSTGESDAPAMRVLEFPVESSGSLSQSELVRLSAQLAGNAGHAGAAYLTYLLQPEVLAWARGKLLALMDETMTVGRFRKEHRFWVRTLAATGVAALLVEKLELISFSPQRIMGWALNHFSQHPEPEVSTSMLMALSQFLNSHLDETLTMPGPAEGRRPFPPIGDKPRRRVTVRVELRGETTWVVERALRDWMERNTGGGYSDLIAELKKENMLRSAKKAMTLTAGTDIEGGQVWCLGFDNGHPLFTGFMREKHEEQRQSNARAKLEVVK